MDELNLYDDLDEFQEQQDKKSKELLGVEEKYEQSLKTIENLEIENKTLTKKIQRIELSFQSLLDTARAELKRKDKEIERLRKEKDDICFRRRIPHQRLNDAETQQFTEKSAQQQQFVKNPFRADTQPETVMDKSTSDKTEKDQQSRDKTACTEDSQKHFVESHKRNRSRDDNRQDHSKKHRHNDFDERHSKTTKPFKNDCDTRNNNDRVLENERCHKEASNRRDRSRNRLIKDHSPNRKHHEKNYSKTSDSSERHRNRLDEAHSRDGSSRRNDHSRENKKSSKSESPERNSKRQERGRSRDRQRSDHHHHSKEWTRHKSRDRKDYKKTSTKSSKSPERKSRKHSKDRDHLIRPRHDSDKNSEKSLRSLNQDLGCKDVTKLRENDHENEIADKEKVSQKPFDDLAHTSKVNTEIILTNISKAKEDNESNEKSKNQEEFCEQAIDEPDELIDDNDKKSLNKEGKEVSTPKISNQTIAELTDKACKNESVSAKFSLDMNQNDEFNDEQCEDNNDILPNLKSAEKNIMPSQKLSTPRKIALFDTIFGSTPSTHSSTNASCSSSNSLLTNIMGILNRQTTTIDLAETTPSPGEKSNPNSCSQTSTKNEETPYDAKEIDKCFTKNDDKAKNKMHNISSIDLTDDKDNIDVNLVDFVQIPGLDFHTTTEQTKTISFNEKLVNLLADKLKDGKSSVKLMEKEGQDICIEAMVPRSEDSNKLTEDPVNYNDCLSIPGLDLLSIAKDNPSKEAERINIDSESKVIEISEPDANAIEISDTDIARKSPSAMNSPDFETSLELNTIEDDKDKSTRIQTNQDVDTTTGTTLVLEKNEEEHVSESTGIGLDTVADNNGDSKPGMDGLELNVSPILEILNKSDTEKETLEKNMVTIDNTNKIFTETEEETEQNLKLVQSEIQNDYKTQISKAHEIVKPNKNIEAPESIRMAETPTTNITTNKSNEDFQVSLPDSVSSENFEDDMDQKLASHTNEKSVDNKVEDLQGSLQNSFLNAALKTHDVRGQNLDSHNTETSDGTLGTANRELEVSSTDSILTTKLTIPDAREKRLDSHTTETETPDGITGTTNRNLEVSLPDSILTTKLTIADARKQNLETDITVTGTLADVRDQNLDSHTTETEIADNITGTPNKKLEVSLPDSILTAKLKTQDVNNQNLDPHTTDTTDDIIVNPNRKLEALHETADDITRIVSNKINKTHNRQLEDLQVSVKDSFKKESVKTIKLEQDTPNSEIQGAGNHTEHEEILIKSNNHRNSIKSDNKELEKSQLENVQINQDSTSPEISNNQTNHDEQESTSSKIECKPLEVVASDLNVEMTTVDEQTNNLQAANRKLEVLQVSRKDSLSIIAKPTDIRVQNVEFHITENTADEKFLSTGNIPKSQLQENVKNNVDLTSFVMKEDSQTRIINKPEEKILEFYGEETKSEGDNNMKSKSHSTDDLGNTNIEAITNATTKDEGYRRIFKEGETKTDMKIISENQSTDVLEENNIETTRNVIQIKAKTDQIQEGETKTEINLLSENQSTDVLDENYTGTSDFNKDASDISTKNYNKMEETLSKSHEGEPKTADEINMLIENNTTEVLEDTQIGSKDKDSREDLIPKTPKNHDGKQEIVKTQDKSSGTLEQSSNINLTERMATRDVAIITENIVMITKDFKTNTETDLDSVTTPFREVEIEELGEISATCTKIAENISESNFAEELYSTDTDITDEVGMIEAVGFDKPNKKQVTNSENNHLNSSNLTSAPTKESLNDIEREGEIVEGISTDEISLDLELIQKEAEVKSMENIETANQEFTSDIEEELAKLHASDETKVKRSKTLDNVTTSNLTDKDLVNETDKNFETSRNVQSEKMDDKSPVSFKPINDFITMPTAQTSPKNTENQETTAEIHASKSTFDSVTTGKELIQATQVLEEDVKPKNNDLEYSNQSANIEFKEPADQDTTISEPIFDSLEANDIEREMMEIHKRSESPEENRGTNDLEVSNKTTAFESEDKLDHPKEYIVETLTLNSIPTREASKEIMEIHTRNESPAMTAQGPFKETVIQEENSITHHVETPNKTTTFESEGKLDHSQGDVVACLTLNTLPTKEASKEIIKIHKRNESSAKTSPDEESTEQGSFEEADIEEESCITNHLEIQNKGTAFESDGKLDHPQGDIVASLTLNTIPTKEALKVIMEINTRNLSPVSTLPDEELPAQRPFKETGLEEENCGTNAYEIPIECEDKLDHPQGDIAATLNLSKETAKDQDPEANLETQSLDKSNDRKSQPDNVAPSNIDKSVGEITNDSCLALMHDIPTVSNKEELEKSLLEFVNFKKESAKTMKLAQDTPNSERQREGSRTEHKEILIHSNDHTNSRTYDNEEMEKSLLENVKNSTDPEISASQANHAEQEAVSVISNDLKISSTSSKIRCNPVVASHLIEEITTVDEQSNNLEAPNRKLEHLQVSLTDSLATIAEPTDIREQNIESHITENTADDKIVLTGNIPKEEDQPIVDHNSSLVHPNATHLAVLSGSKGHSKLPFEKLVSSNEILHVDSALVMKYTSAEPNTIKPVPTGDCDKLLTAPLEMSSTIVVGILLPHEISNVESDNIVLEFKEEHVLKAVDPSDNENDEILLKTKDDQNSETLKLITKLSDGEQSNSELKEQVNRDAEALKSLDNETFSKLNDDFIIHPNEETKTQGDSKLQDSIQRRDLKANKSIEPQDMSSNLSLLIDSEGLNKDPTSFDELTKKSEDIVQTSSTKESGRIKQIGDNENTISKKDSITNPTGLDKAEEMKSAKGPRVSETKESQQNLQTIPENDTGAGAKQLPTRSETIKVLNKDIVVELLMPEVEEHKVVPETIFNESQQTSSKISIPQQKEMSKMQLLIETPIAMPDAYNVPTILPSIPTNSPTPPNFSGLFSKKSLQVAGEDDFITQKPKRRPSHLSTNRPREYVLLAASVLCNVDNLENATKPNKKLHWELLENKNELTEIEDDTDVDNTDEERNKAKEGEAEEQNEPQEPPPRLTPYKCTESLTSDSETQSDNDSRYTSLPFLHSATNKQKPVDQRRKTIDTVPITQAVSYFKHLEELEQKKNGENKSKKKKEVKKQLTFLTNKVKKNKHSKQKLSKNVKEKLKADGVIRVRNVQTLMQDGLVKEAVIKAAKKHKIVNKSQAKETPQAVRELKKRGRPKKKCDQKQKPDQQDTNEIEPTINNDIQIEGEEKRSDNSEIKLHSESNQKSNKNEEQIEDLHLKSNDQQHEEIADEPSLLSKVNKSLDDHQIYEEFLSNCSKPVKKRRNTIIDDQEAFSSDNSEIAFSQENVKRNKNYFKNRGSTSKLENEPENKTSKNDSKLSKGNPNHTSEHVKSPKKQLENIKQRPIELVVEPSMKQAIAKNVNQSGSVNEKYLSEQENVADKGSKSIDVVTCKVAALETSKTEFTQDSINSEQSEKNTVTKDSLREIKTSTIPLEEHDMETTHNISMIYEKEDSIDDHNISVAENSEPECNKYLQEDKLPSIVKETKAPEKSNLQTELSNVKEQKLSVLENHCLQNEKPLEQQQLKERRDSVKEPIICEKYIQHPNEEKSKATQTDNQTQKSIILTKTNSRITKSVHKSEVVTNNKKKIISLEEIGIKVRPFKGHLSSFRIPKVNKDLEGAKDKSWKLETYSEVANETQHSNQSKHLSSFRIPKVNKELEGTRDKSWKLESYSEVSNETQHSSQNNKLNIVCDKEKYVSSKEKEDKRHHQYKEKKPENDKGGLALKLKKDESKLSDLNKIGAYKTKEKDIFVKERKEDAILPQDKEKSAKRTNENTKNCESKIKGTSRHIRYIEDTHQNSQDIHQQAIYLHNKAEGPHSSKDNNPINKITKEKDIFVKERKEDETLSQEREKSAKRTKENTKYCESKIKGTNQHIRYIEDIHQNRQDKTQQAIDLHNKADGPHCSKDNNQINKITKEKDIFVKETKEDEILPQDREKSAKRTKENSKYRESKIKGTNQHICYIEDIHQNRQDKPQQAIDLHNKADGPHCSEDNNPINKITHETLKINQYTKNIPTTAKETKLNEMRDLKGSSEGENQDNKEEEDTCKDQRKSLTNKRKLFSPEMYSFEETCDNINPDTAESSDRNNLEINNEQNVNEKLQEIVQKWTNKNSNSTTSQDKHHKSDSEDNICRVTQKSSNLKSRRKSMNLQRRILDSSSDEEHKKIPLKSSQSSQDNKTLKTLKARRKSVNLYRRILDSSCEEDNEKETLANKNLSHEIQESQPIIDNNQTVKDVVGTNRPPVKALRMRRKSMYQERVSTNIQQEGVEMENNLELNTQSSEQIENMKESKKPLRIRRKSMYQENYNLNDQLVEGEIENGQAENSLDKNQLEINTLNKERIEANPLTTKPISSLKMRRKSMFQEKVSSNYQQEMSGVDINKDLETQSSIDKNHLEMINPCPTLKTKLNRRKSMYHECVTVNSQEKETNRNNQDPLLQTSKDKTQLEFQNKQKDETNPLPTKSLKIRRKSMYQEKDSSNYQQEMSGVYINKDLETQISIDKNQLDVINSSPTLNTELIRRKSMYQECVTVNSQEEDTNRENQDLVFPNRKDQNHLELQNKQKDETNAPLKKSLKIRRKSMYQESGTLNMPEEGTKRDNQDPLLQSSKDRNHLEHKNKREYETNPPPTKSLKMRRKSMYQESGTFNLDQERETSNKEELLESKSFLDKNQLEISNCNKQKDDAKPPALKMRRKSMYQEREVPHGGGEKEERNPNLITNIEKTVVLSDEQQKTVIDTKLRQLDNESLNSRLDTSNSNFNKVPNLNMEEDSNKNILDAGDQHNQPTNQTQNVMPTSLKTKPRKRRIVKVLSTSREEPPPNYFKNLQVQPNTAQTPITPPLASPTLSHPIFTTEVIQQQTEFAPILPPTPNKQYDDKFKEIDSKLHEIFQSPQYMVDYKTTTHLLDATHPIPLNDSKPNITIEETMVGNQENCQSSMNTTNHNDSMDINDTSAHNQSETKHLLMGSSQYRFEKVSEDVVKLFISRKRKRKRTN